MTYEEWRESEDGYRKTIRISQQTVGGVDSALEAGFEAGFEAGAAVERKAVCLYIRKRIAESGGLSRDEEITLIQLHNQIEQGCHLSDPEPS